MLLQVFFSSTSSTICEVTSGDAFESMRFSIQIRACIITEQHHPMSVAFFLSLPVLFLPVPYLWKLHNSLGIFAAVRFRADEYSGRSGANKVSPKPSSCPLYYCYTAMSMHFD